MKIPYTELAAKYQLPPVSQWVNLEESVTLTDVRKAFQDKLFGFADMLHMLLHPDDLQAMLESESFTETDRSAMELLYKEMMLLAKDGQLLDIESSDELEAEQVRRMVAAWPSLAQRMQRVVKQTKEAYNGRQQQSSTVSYLG